MDRELARLRRAARLVEADLRRTASPDWVCRVDDEFVLSVSSGGRTESVLLGREIEDDAWYVRDDATDEQQQAAFDDEPTEAVADEVLEVLRVYGTSLADVSYARPRDVLLFGSVGLRRPARTRRRRSGLAGPRVTTSRRGSAGSWRRRNAWC